MKKEQEVKNYEAPKVEVIEVQVEKGFAASDDLVPNSDDFGWGNE